MIHGHCAHFEEYPRSFPTKFFRLVLRCAEREGEDEKVRHRWGARCRDLTERATQP